MGRRPAFYLCILCSMLLTAMGEVRAQDLLGRQIDPRGAGIDQARERSDASRFRYAHVNPGMLKRTDFLLNLFPDYSIRAVGRSAARQFNAETWIGQVEGEPLSSVIFAADDNGALFGKVELGGRMFIVRPKAGPIHAILEVSDKVEFDEGYEDAVPLPESGSETAVSKGTAASACLSTSTCSNKTIDVMVVYTSMARSALGGTAAAETAVAAAVAEMNAANANSGVTHTFNLVYTDEVWYVESGNASTDLSRLSGNFDGHMDQIHTWRDTYGADLVSLITDTGGCGIGYIQSDPTLLSSNAAFNVVRDDCMTTNRSLAHEIGHNMGLHHDWYVSSNTTPCLWHHGYVNQEAFGGTSAQRWRTVMAYNNQCVDQGGFNCSRLAYWSNPQKLTTNDEMGIPQGQSNPSDAAFALNRTSCQVAEFRPSVSSPEPPMYPTNLVATGASQSSINVNWTDNATDETGYKVQRSANGTSGWSDVATLGANVQTYLDSGLPGGSAFYYRTYAFHAMGQSEYSNVDSASTMISYTDYTAGSETLRYGASSSQLTRTYSNDGFAEVLNEEETDGWLDNRTSRLDVRWEFEVPAGLPLVLHLNAWTPASGDNDEMLLSYSWDGQSFSPMFILSEATDTNEDQSHDLGVSPASSVWVRLEDTDRNRGSRAIDYVYVDHLFIRAETSGDEGAPAPEIETIHLADLRATVTGNRRWTSTIEVSVHGSGHAAAAGVTVSGVWNDGLEVACVTEVTGSCVVETTWKPKVGGATFTLTSLSKEGAEYFRSFNESPETVTIAAPHELAKDASSSEIPARLTLEQNYPNPFNPSTVLAFGLPEAMSVSVSVFNSIGEEVERLYDGSADAGWHRITFDRPDLSSGVYFAVVRADGATATRTMLLMK